MSVILGIDLGTSSVKAMLLDTCSGDAVVETVTYNIDIPKEGYAEQNPDKWWDSTIEVLKRLRQRYRKAYDAVEVVGLSGQMHGLVLVDEQGRPVRPAILWLDQRADIQASEMNNQIGFEKLGEIFRNRVYSGFAFPSLLWIKQNEPKTLEQTKSIMMPKDYIRFKMTGEIGTDVSDASAATAFDTPKRRWSDGIIEEYGLPKAIFPHCGESVDISGEISEECSRQCGLKKGVKVIFGCGDQMAQSVGNGVVSQGKIISNIGTGGQISTYISQPQYDPLLRTHTFCHAINNAYTIFGAVLCGGMSLKWLKDEVLRVDNFAQISKMAGEISPGSNGLIFLPYLSGERTPHMNPHARGLLFGMNLSQDRRTISRAVMEGVTYSLKDTLRIFEEIGLEQEMVIASGGGSQSGVWLQIQADIFNKPVTVCKVKEQACLGACLLAGVGSGIFNDISEGIGSFVSFESKIYLPIKNNTIEYEKGYEVFRGLYKATCAYMD